MLRDKYHTYLILVDQMDLDIPEWEAMGRQLSKEFLTVLASVDSYKLLEDEGVQWDLSNQLISDLADITRNLVLGIDSSIMKSDYVLLIKELLLMMDDQIVTSDLDESKRATTKLYLGFLRILRQTIEGEEDPAPLILSINWGG